MQNDQPSMSFTLPTEGGEASVLNFKHLEGGAARQMLLSWLLISGIISRHKKSAPLSSYFLENSHFVGII